MQKEFDLLPPEKASLAEKYQQEVFDLDNAAITFGWVLRNLTWQATCASSWSACWNPKSTNCVGVARNRSVAWWNYFDL